MQIQDRIRHPVRYKSRAWTKAKKLYNATKRECRAVLYAIRRLRFYVYSIHFILETDSNVLVQQLKGSASNVPGAYVTRWLAMIRTYNFTIQHIKGAKNTIADALSRKPSGPSDKVDQELKGDIKDQYNASLNQLSQPQSSNQSIPLLNTYFQSEESLKIAQYLHYKTYPRDLTPQQQSFFHKKAHRFFIHKGTL